MTKMERFKKRVDEQAERQRAILEAFRNILNKKTTD